MRRAAVDAIKQNDVVDREDVVIDLLVLTGREVVVKDTLSLFIFEEFQWHGGKAFRGYDDLYPLEGLGVPLLLLDETLEVGRQREGLVDGIGGD